jgi:hypothetical protein
LSQVIRALRRYSRPYTELHLSETRRPFVGSGNPIERTVTVAVPIQPTHQLATVCVPERDRDIL